MGMKAVAEAGFGIPNLHLRYTMPLPDHPAIFLAQVHTLHILSRCRATTTMAMTGCYTTGARTGCITTTSWAVRLGEWGCVRQGG